MYVWEGEGSSVCLELKNMQGYVLYFWGLNFVYLEIKSFSPSKTEMELPTHIKYSK